MHDDLSAINSLLSNNFNVIYFDTIDSTNNYAKKLIRENINIKNNTLIVADCQTAGRGRSGHNFVSPSGTGIYMTLILNPVEIVSLYGRDGQRPERAQMITIAAAVSVCLALEKFVDLNVKVPLIKWVNDIFMCYKNTKSDKPVRREDVKSVKVCGILAEAVTGNSGEIDKIIVGIGVNVWPHDFNDLNQAGTVFDEVKSGVTRAEIAAEIALNLVKFSAMLDNLSPLSGEMAEGQRGFVFPIIGGDVRRPERANEIINNYRERMIFNTDFHSGNISYMKDNKRHFGHVLNIDDDGGLIVKSRDTDEVITLRSGEIFEVREDF